MGKSDRGIWGDIKGSGSSPYKILIDFTDLATKCSCPSRQFPCKHGLGLLLVYTSDPNQLKISDEPDYVREWLDKRQAKTQQKTAEASELTEEEIEKKSASKEKREEERSTFVDSGVSELKLVLKDFIRLGLLELSTKNTAYFDGIAARMIDAKAPGLANWVKEFGKVDFKNKATWQEQSLELIAKVYLILKSYENINQLDTGFQSTLRNVIGWTHQTKDLLTDKTTLTQKDNWLVLGSSTEIQDDFTIIRTWLHGLQSNQNALILAFENKFSNNATQKFLDGTTLEAELAFYPDNIPHRAFIKQQKSTSDELPQEPQFLQNWLEFHDLKIKQLQKNPWLYSQSYLIKNVKLFGYENNWVIADSSKKYMRLNPTLEFEKILKLLLLTNHNTFSLAFTEQKDGIIPLGLFLNKHYQVI